MIDGATRVAAVIGWPIAHSLSPALHNAAFAALGLPWVYVACPVRPGEGAAALAAARALGLAGLSVTMPHKEDVARSVDRLDPLAARLRSVNTVAVGPEGELVGHSTDGPGFLASLAEAGVDVAGKRVCVLGAGGAGRAVALAVHDAGAAHVAIVNRTPARAEELVAILGARAAVAAVDAADEADLIVNATPQGMGEARVPSDPARLGPGQTAVDLVYHPLCTEWLAGAERAGATIVDGLGMLVHQAALAQQVWHGSLPDVGVMRAAALAELAKRAPSGATGAD